MSLVYWSGQGAWGTAPVRAKAGEGLEISNRQSQREPGTASAQPLPCTERTTEDPKKGSDLSKVTQDLGSTAWPPAPCLGLSRHWGQVEQFCASTCPCGNNPGVGKICMRNIRGFALGQNPLPHSWLCTPPEHPLRRHPGSGHGRDSPRPGAGEGRGLGGSHRRSFQPLTISQQGPLSWRGGRKLEEGLEHTIY